VTCLYKGYYRELCPIIIGHTRGQERVLAFHFGGHSSSGLPAHGNWKCLDLSQIDDPKLRDGLWHEGASHTKQQTCVEDVDLDVNIHVRKRRS
jgi:hypothetical protein